MQPGHRGHRANRGRKATSVKPARKAPRETPEPQGQKVIKAIPVLRDRRANKVLKESRGLRAIQENKGQQVPVFLMAVLPDNCSVKRNPALNG